MTIRQDMLIAASRAKNLLGDSAELVAGFLRNQLNPDGGFKNRFGQSDLYYTVFGIEALLALNEHVPQEQIESFLQRFSDCISLDLVHLACLARCWADLAPRTQDVKYKTGRGGFSPFSLYKKKSVGQAPPYNCCMSDEQHQIFPFIENYRSNDGGFNNIAGAAHGTAYGCFLALGAYQDLSEDRSLPASGRTEDRRQKTEDRKQKTEDRKVDSIVNCIKTLQRADGGYANEPSLKISSATATAAAVTILHYLNEPISESTVNWLFSCFHPKGGFAVSSCVMRDEYCDGKNTQYAIRNTQNGPLPDLLSTATALHALSLAGASIEHIKEQCLDFLDSLWSPQSTVLRTPYGGCLSPERDAVQAGGFRGNWADETLDCEYAYYGLLALGHLNDKNPT